MTSQFGSYNFLFLILFLCPFVKVFYSFQFYSSNQICDFCFFDDKNDFNVVFFLFIFYCFSWSLSKKIVFNYILQIEFLIFIFSIIIIIATTTTMIVIVLVVILIITMMFKNNNNCNDGYDDGDNGDADIIDDNSYNNDTMTMIIKIVMKIKISLITTTIKLITIIMMMMI